MLILYVAGPMSGLPDFNYPAFREAEAELVAAGFAVKSPHWLGEDDQTQPWDYYMRGSLRMLSECDAVALLPGWEMSKGATLEHLVARSLGMETKPLAEWLLAATMEAA